MHSSLIGTETLLEKETQELHLRIIRVGCSGSNCICPQMVEGAQAEPLPEQKRQLMKRPTPAKLLIKTIDEELGHT